MVDRQNKVHTASPISVGRIGLYFNGEDA
jgi:hypothetical protein